MKNLKLSERFMYYSGLLVAMKGTDVIDDLNHIADLLEAEEEGLLLRLPCKVGDEVYTACSWGIENGVVGSIEIISDRVFVNNPFGAMIGEAHNIYLTKAEAEKALAEMEK